MYFFGVSTARDDFQLFCLSLWWKLACLLVSMPTFTGAGPCAYARPASLFPACM